MQPGREALKFGPLCDASHFLGDQEEYFFRPNVGVADVLFDLDQSSSKRGIIFFKKPDVASVW